VATDATTSNDRFCYSGSLFAESFKPPYNFAIVIDISGSTRDAFAGTAVGDVNGDGLFNNILDAEIASVLAFLDSIASNPNLDNSNVNIGLISFKTVAVLNGTYNPLDSTNTVPNPALVAALKNLRSGPVASTGFTNFDDALDKTVDYFNIAPDVTTRTNVLFFLSDGVPTVDGDGDGEADPGRESTSTRADQTKFNSELALLNAKNVVRLSIGVGSSSRVGPGSALDEIDNTPDPITGVYSQQVTTSNGLTSLLLANPVVGSITSLQVKVNGVLQPGITAANAVSGPTGFTFGSFVLTGLVDTPVGYNNVIETTVIVTYNGVSRTITTTNHIIAVA
jgi:hypothetical protein